MPYISKIKLNPEASAYDLRDNAAEHFLGKSTNTITDNTAVTGSYTIDGATVQADAIKENDVITDSTGHQFIARTVSNTLTWVKITPTAPSAEVQDVDVDGTSVLNTTNHHAEFATTGAISGEDAYDGDSASENYNPIATKAYVDAAVEELPQAMIFRGTLGTTGTIASLPTASADTVGDVYKVIEAGTYATQAAEVGDLFIGTEVEGTPVTYTWTLVPSGDVPAGTVTQITAGTGLTTADGAPITSEGTIKANLDSETAIDSTDPDFKYVGVDSTGKLAYNTPSTVDDATNYPYNNDSTSADYNPLATKKSAAAQITAAIGELDKTLTNSGTTVSEVVYPAAATTITKITETDGILSDAGTDFVVTPISIANAQVNDITRTGAVTGFAESTTVLTDVNTTESGGANIAFVDIGKTTADSDTLIFFPIYSHSTTANTSLAKILQDNSTT